MKKNLNFLRFLPKIYLRGPTMKRIFLALFSAILLLSLQTAQLPAARAGELSNEQCALTNTGDRYPPEWQNMLLSFRQSEPDEKKRPARKRSKGKGSKGLD